MSGGETMSFFVPFQLICCVDVWRVTYYAIGQTCKITSWGSFIVETSAIGGDLRPQQETETAAERVRSSNAKWNAGGRAASGSPKFQPHGARAATSDRDEVSMMRLLRERERET